MAKIKKNDYGRRSPRLRKAKKKKKTDWVGMTVPRVGEAVEKLAL